MRRAYSDRLGVTAQFNYNLLRRINNEFNANFDLGSFYHVANFNVALGGMESWLISSKDQTVRTLSSAENSNRKKTVVGSLSVVSFAGHGCRWSYPVVVRLSLIASRVFIPSIHSSTPKNP
mmetsp:Transcript_6254/g.26489  ORF Transcript_6254/g.26489 Transcript_6254/m.26489 type:complete len:121 (+) Transcript_6254:1316-1678(+)